MPHERHITAGDLPTFVVWLVPRRKSVLVLFPLGFAGGRMRKRYYGNAGSRGARLWVAMLFVEVVAVSDATRLRPTPRPTTPLRHNTIIGGNEAITTSKK